MYHTSLHFVTRTFRKEDIEAKYYADGEDAFAMKRDLGATAEALKTEEEQRRKRHQREKAAAETQAASSSNTSTSS